MITDMACVKVSSAAFTKDTANGRINLPGKHFLFLSHCQSFVLTKI